MPELVETRTSVLVVGGGPVGMFTALELARHGIPSIIIERNLATTEWPKMDLSNCRTMEILRINGIADEYRQIDGAVGEDSPFIDLYHTGMSPKSKFLATCVSSFV